MFSWLERLRWQTWPTSTFVEQIVKSCDRQANLVVLLGRPDSPCGRYGLIGEPSAVKEFRDVGELLQDGCHPRPYPTVLLAGYEMGHRNLGLPEKLPPRGQPAGLLFELSNALVLDYYQQKYAIVGTFDIQASIKKVHKSPSNFFSLAPVVDDGSYVEQLRQIQEHIAAGDIYQANLTRRLRVHGEFDGLTLLLTLGRLNPVAHGAYLKFHNLQLCSNSMETLLTVDADERVAWSYPIKGTTPRGPAINDAEAQWTLVNSTKDQAEHIMIVDLVRNDLGKVAKAGGVTVPHLMQPHPHHSVWHLVSAVRASLRDDVTLADVVAAIFPGGSISGAPKYRAVQLLDAVEREPRGYYTGTLGVIWPDASASLSILIRTLVHDNEGWSLNVGGGIVADSEPAKEIAETWQKVAVFQKAFSMIARPRRPTANVINMT